MSQKDEPRCDVRTHSAEAHEKQANSPREGNLHFTQLVRNFANLCPSLVKLLHRQPIILVLRQFPKPIIRLILTLHQLFQLLVEGNAIESKVSVNTEYR